jgi:hypothetical protein
LGLFIATRSAGVAGFVSEAGVTGAPHGALYRASVWAIALALALLAVALRRADGLAALAVAVASPLIVVSGAVRCSAGCPLPPYERATAADLVHAAASVAALLLCAAGIFRLAMCAADPGLRRISRAGTAVAVPLLGTAGLGLLFAGRGAVTGVFERAALLAVLAWVIAASGRLARRPEAVP